MPNNKPDKPSPTPGAGASKKSSHDKGPHAKLARARASVAKALEGRPPAKPPRRPSPEARPPVPIRNLETGLRRVMVAAFTAKGMSSTEADAKATSRMPDAVKLFHKATTAVASEGEANRAVMDRLTAALKTKGQSLKDAAPVVAADAPRHVRLAAEFKGKRFVVRAPGGKPGVTIGLGMGAVARWAKKLA